ncbi:MAG: hypothetical protein J0I41_14060 [Filimonas sp.]|nr:hypothetical protein [Filimonas sp.]
MEPQQTNFELELDDVSVVSMTQAAKWAKIIAIIFAVCCALGVLFGLFASTMLGTFMSQYGGAYGSMFSAMSGFIAVIILIVAAIAGVFIYLLLSFANNTSRAMLTKDPVSLEKGTGALKNYFLLGGIFAILGLLFTLINLFR